MTIASQTSLQALAIGLTAIDVFAADPAADAPEWIKLTPRGAFTARDGRQFDTMPEVLVERFQADGVDIPIDIDHATVTRPSKGEEAPAVGWIKQLQARADGLYGRVTWLQSGLSVLTAKSHRYISPTLKSDGAGRAIWLHSAALVAAPGISMPAVASAQSLTEGASDMDAKPIALALGLAETAGQTEILAAILGLKHTSAALSATATKSLSTLAVELGKDRVAMIQNQREAKADEAIRRGVIPPSLRQWSLDLMAADEAQFDTFCASVGTPLGHLFRSQITDRGPLAEADRAYGQSTTVDHVAAADVARQLGIDPKTLTG